MNADLCFDVSVVANGEGFWIATDPKVPDAFIPLFSKDGKIYSMRIDEEFRQDGFIEGVRFHGPYLPE